MLDLNVEIAVIHKTLEQYIACVFQSHLYFSTDGDLQSLCCLQHYQSTPTNSSGSKSHLSHNSRYLFV